jgi:hypothetical protein
VSRPPHIEFTSFARMAQRRFARLAQMPHQNAHFRTEPIEGRPDRSPDSHQILGWEVFLERSAPTAIFARVIRYEGRTVHGSNRVSCFQCRTRIQYSASVRHYR